MDDHQQYVHEMNLVFELLENLIRELPVTIAKQDLLCDYATQLKEAAYQAGRADKNEKVS